MPAAAPVPQFPAPQPEFNFGHHEEEPVEQTPLEDKVGLLLLLDIFHVFLIN